HHGMPRREAELVELVLRLLRAGPARAASLAEAGDCDAALVLGEDVTQTAPMLAHELRRCARQQPWRAARRLGIPEWHDLAVRTAAQGDAGPLFVVSPAPTRLDDAARAVMRAVPEEAARLGHAVAHALDPGSAPPEGLGEPAASLARRIAGDLAAAERPLVVSGTGCGAREPILAAAAVARALERGPAAGKVRVTFTLPECDSLGAALLGGGSLEDALEALRRGAPGLLVVENDLHRRAPAAEVERALAGVPLIGVIDLLDTRCARAASACLPAASWAEGDGTFVNNEGRAQRFYQVLPPDGGVAESWRWVRDLARAAGRADIAAWRHLDDVALAMGRAEPALAAVPPSRFSAGFRVTGAKIPREPHRASGRTALLAHIAVREKKPPDDPDGPFSFSMEGAGRGVPGPLLPRFWHPGWNSAQAVHRFQQEVLGPLRGGEPGLRLIEPDGPARPEDHGPPPPPFRRRNGAWRVAPLHHVFGSEELSRLAPGIAQLAPLPYLALGPEEASSRGLVEGTEIAVREPGGAWESRLPLRILAGLPAGVAGLPRGLDGIEQGPLPDWIEQVLP
ncbi:MAG TPA: molybdopterin-dependent oxidoreductase, partial [Candidatus Polarisedimenticolia bacterium]|nr:molybdopterin-dependent oxidoreductase [Candidatus Polarisedimenticolia bacterium]